MTISPTHQEPVLPNLEDFHVWPAKYRHWMIEVAESPEHVLWLCTEHLRALFPTLPEDNRLKVLYRGAVFYVKSEKRHYVREGAMRKALQPGRDAEQNTEKLKFLDWFERHIAQAAQRKRHELQRQAHLSGEPDDSSTVLQGPVQFIRVPRRLEQTTQRMADLDAAGRAQWLHDHPQAKGYTPERVQALPPVPWGVWGRAKLQEAWRDLLSFVRGERNPFLTFLAGAVLLWLPSWLLYNALPESLDLTTEFRLYLWWNFALFAWALLAGGLLLVGLTRSTLRCFALPGGLLWAGTWYVLCFPWLVQLLALNWSATALEEWWDWTRGHYQPAEVYADPYLGRIVVTGQFRFGSAEALRAVMARNPKLTLIQLESPGGFVLEGFAMARLVQDQHMDTVSMRGCYSACTFVLTAGRERYLGPEVNVGFHRSGTRYGPVTNHWSWTDYRVAEQFRKRGVKSEFIAKAMSQPITGIWIASHAEMFDAAYADLPWSERRAGY